MSQESNQPGIDKRKELPIERGFPIERVNEIAENEGRAGMHYRPIYTMHKWWARRLGCVFRTISLYTLVDNGENVDVRHPATDKPVNLGEIGLSDYEDLQHVIDSVSQADPEPLWQLYTKDVTVDNRKLLDPFMGGGTSVVESSRFGAEVVGNDLNPVAWFVSKKEIEAGETDIEDLESGFEKVKEDVAERLKSYYQTSCPNDDHDADVMYYFWTKELDCVSCGETVSLFNDYRIGKARYDDKEKGDYNVICPSCESITLVDDWKSESICTDCGHEFVPQDGNASGSKYTCRECGQKYDITNAIQEQNGFDTRLYGLEWFCPTCDNHKGMGRSDVKGYKQAEETDRELFEDAKSEWEENEELNQYVPTEDIRPGWKTSSKEFEGNAPGAGDIFDHGYEKWKDMFNERQLLCLSTLLRSIDRIENQNIKEYLLLAISESLRFNSSIINYQASANKIQDLWKTNSFDPPQGTTEGNVWGTEFGMGSFTKTYNMVKTGIEYANSPTERYINKDGGTEETAEFNQPIGEDVTIFCDDAKNIDAENEYDVVLTDPPYYNNVMYSELSDYNYVWLRILLKHTYEEFEDIHTPRAESIVSNPAENKGTEEFEDELKQAFSTIERALKPEGVLTFTYHHSDSESWGELLEALCEVGFEVTASYPISADVQKFTKGEAVSFDIVVVARPIDETSPVPWNVLRREIYRTARRTRKQLEENRDLSRGDIGVMEMGACFREYSKHHGKVQREGETMSAKEVVEEIYGIIQEASTIGVEDVFIDLLDTVNVSYDDVNKLCRGTNTTPNDLKEMFLYSRDDGFKLGTWDNEKRQAYIQERVNGDDDHLSNLDKLQFLRYRYEKGQSVQNYVDKWGVDDDLRELAGRLADVTEDDTYTRVLGDRDITSYNDSS